mgnify:CR=1 FL=1
MNKFQKQTVIEKVKLVIHYGVRFAEKVSDRYTAACAAQAAFFIMLSVVPIVSLILALATYLPFTQQDVMNLVMSVIPNEFTVYVSDILNDLYDDVIFDKVIVCNLCVDFLCQFFLSHILLRCL